MNRILSFVLALFIPISCWGGVNAGSEIPQPCEIPDGAWGIFQIPCIEINEPLYYTEISSQRIIDKDNCADVTRMGNGYAILDHQASVIGQNGGVWAESTWDVNQISVGTSAFLFKDDDIGFYHCTAVMLCEQIGNSWYYENHAIRPHTNDILCVCCASPYGDDMRYIAYFDFDGMESEVFS